ncbi:hypothetical protein FE781_06905 [Paenibacillus thermoaerophilus]|nr:hypothetical protein FE781_06905 [Paenibacillus thermoaerophilus]
MLADRTKNISPRDEERIDTAKIWRELLALAEGYLQEQSFRVTYPSASYVMEVSLPLKEPQPIPDPPGFVDYPYWTMFSRAVEERLTVLASVYVLARDRRYADKVKEYLLALAEFSKWYEFPRRGAEGNLSNAHFLIGYSVAYDAIHGELSEYERDVCLRAILNLGLKPLAIDFGNDDMHNIITAKQVAMLYGACAVYDEAEQEAAPYLAQAVSYLRSYLDRKLVTHETEGLLYTNVAVRHVWMAAETYRKATGDATLCDHPYLSDLVPELFLRLLSPGSAGTFPNLSDSFERIDATYVMTMTAARHRHPAAMWYVETFGREKREALLYLPEPCEAVHPDLYYGDRKSRIFAEIGWAALRSGWGERDRLLCLTSSASAQGHNHRDQNNVVLNQSGEWLLVNPGYQDYRPGPGNEFTVGTVGHNSLLVDGLGQTVYGGGRLAGDFLSPGFEWVCGDASAAYPDLLASYGRTVYHLDNRWFVLVDEIELARADQTPELLFHTRAQIWCGDRKLEPGDRAERAEFAFRGERSTLFIQTVSPDPLTADVKVYPGAESYGPYVGVAGHGGGLRRTFATLLAPSDGSDALPPAASLACGRASAAISVGERDGRRNGRFAASLTGKPERLEAGALSADALALWELRDAAGELLQAAVRRANRLAEGDRVLLQSDAPVEASLQRREGEVCVTIACDRTAVVNVELGSAVTDALKLQAGEKKTLRYRMP